MQKLSIPDSAGSMFSTARRNRNPRNKLEAASGFEPLHRGFADLSLNHLGTPPLAEVEA
jgi:hypothetical protein